MTSPPARVLRSCVASLLTFAALSAGLAACAGAHGTAAPAPGGERPVLVGYLAGWGVRSKGTRID
jgi:hypothetical protein